VRAPVVAGRLVWRASRQQEDERMLIAQQIWVGFRPRLWAAQVAVERGVELAQGGANLGAPKRLESGRRERGDGLERRLLGVIG
jgi:hypothetical protein